MTHLWILPEPSANAGPPPERLDARARLLTQGRGGAPNTMPAPAMSLAIPPGLYFKRCVRSPKES
jgi:hypothetical protein